MLAVCLDNGKRAGAREGAAAAAAKDSRLIRLLYGGICNTDLELQRGYYGFRGTPGHEFVGEVVEADDRDWIGQRVVGEINLACGKCAWCARGLGTPLPEAQRARNRETSGRVPRISDVARGQSPSRSAQISNEQAVFVEPLAAACEILDQVRIPAGARVAVLGDGKLGLLIGQVLHAHGAEVHQYGRHGEKLKIARAAGNHPIVVRNASCRSQSMIDSGSDWFKQGLQQAVAMTQPRGTVIMKSTVPATSRSTRRR